MALNHASDAGRTDLWSSCGPSGVLLKNDVHVWLVRLDDSAAGIDACADWLSSTERERAARFKFARDRSRYAIAHGALRAILGRYLSVDPGAIDFDAGPAGKPKLAPRWAGAELEFNLSHSGEVALIAVTRGAEIGIDVERIRQAFAFEPIAQRFFTGHEVAALRSLPVDLQREAFYKCWTSKEALLKAKGSGLSAALDEVCVAVTGTGIRITPARRGWVLREVRPIPGYAAALAVKQRPRNVQCCRWEASMLLA